MHRAVLTPLVTSQFQFHFKERSSKISYECRAYESVDDKILSWAIYQKTMKNGTRDWKG